MEIKQILNNNLTDATRLIAEVFMEFEAPDYSQEGVKTFFDTALSNQEFMNSLTIYGSYNNGKLNGVIATINKGSHIALFFVDSMHQRQGIGRSLFEVVLKNCNSNELTVNSSPYAKDFYHRLGFEDTNVEQTITGIRFIPMKYVKRA